MAEPVVAPDPVAAPVVAPVEPTVFSWDTWNQSLDEELRTEKSLESFKHAKSKDELTALLAKSFVNTKKMVGANVIPVPGDASTEGEWQEYHKAGGRPETVADYNLKAPEGFPEEIAGQIFPEARMQQWQERFFKGGVSKKAADEFIKEFAQDMLADYQLSEQAKVTQKEELVAGLSTDWGAAYDQKIHLGNMAIEEGTAGNDEFKARIVAKVEHDPDLTRLLANLGGKFAEGKPAGFAAIPTPNDYQDQIDALMADPLYTNGTAQQRMKIADKLVALRKLQKPEPATT